MTKFSSANFQATSYWDFRLEGKQCRWATSSRSTLFANSPIFVSGTWRVKNMLAVADVLRCDVLGHLIGLIWWLCIFCPIFWEKNHPLNATWYWPRFVFMGLHGNLWKLLPISWKLILSDRRQWCERGIWYSKNIICLDRNRLFPNKDAATFDRAVKTTISHGVVGGRNSTIIVTITIWDCTLKVYGYSHIFLPFVQSHTTLVTSCFFHGQKNSYKIKALQALHGAPPLHLHQAKWPSLIFAHHPVMLYICTKFCEIIWNDIKVLEWTWFLYWKLHRGIILQKDIISILTIDKITKGHKTEKNVGVTVHNQSLVTLLLVPSFVKLSQIVSKL